MYMMIAIVLLARCAAENFSARKIVLLNKSEKIRSKKIQ